MSVCVCVFSQYICVAMVFIHTVAMYVHAYVYMYTHTMHARGVRRTGAKVKNLGSGSDNYKLRHDMYMYVCINAQTKLSIDRSIGMFSSRDHMTPI